MVIALPLANIIPAPAKSIIAYGTVNPETQNMPIETTDRSSRQEYALQT